MRRAAFLDRDGVINVDHAYVSRFEDFDFIDGVLDAARRLVDAGFVLVIVTNQSGIGRGYYTEADFHKLDQAVRAVFAEHGAPISATYFCPHHPTKALPPWKCECNCRKPAPGMILQAAKDLDIDLSQSAMFGDKASDMQAAKAAGVAVRVQLDAGRYRQRQDEKLREIALALAERVRQTGRSFSTRPLSSYHRRIVHLTLQDAPDVQTRSTGDGPLKRVVICRRRPERGQA